MGGPTSSKEANAEAAHVPQQPSAAGDNSRLAGADVAEAPPSSMDDVDDASMDLDDVGIDEEEEEEDYDDDDYVNVPMVIVLGLSIVFDCLWALLGSFVG